MASPDAPAAFVTIGALAKQLGLPHHTLRYWETRFAQLKPVQRAGGRRYYRAEDVTLAHRIHHLLTTEGYTFKGVQQILAGGSAAAAERAVPETAPAPKVVSSILPGLIAIRDRLTRALADDLAA